jgi:nitrite reductase/ring-hydroxylating ferredoxin subunit
MAKFVAACKVEDVVEGQGHPVFVSGVPLAIYRDKGQFHALLGRCPHSGGPLGRGWVEEGEAVCPLHRWRFQLATGRCMTVRGMSVHRFPCEVREGQVWVAV